MSARIIAAEEPTADQLRELGELALEMRRRWNAWEVAEDDSAHEAWSAAENAFAASADRLLGANQDYWRAPEAPEALLRGGAK